MKQPLTDRMKEDPSDIKQSFADITIKLHCCRYWMLSEWEFTNMAFPFWRLYYNSIPGASVYYKNTCTNLTSDKIVVIPPDTPFSTGMVCSDLELSRERVIGRRISKLSVVDKLADLQMVDHLFVHFNLGLRYDSVDPGIYEFPVNNYISDLLDKTRSNCVKVLANYNFHTCLPVISLIHYVLLRLPDEKWRSNNIDKRISNMYLYIENNLHEKLTNAFLSNRINMAANSFARLFRENTGLSVQHYIQKRRIERSLMQLHHSVKSIEQIASECGFIDRHHFSKVFKKVMNMSPAYYRKRLTF